MTTTKKQMRTVGKRFNGGADMLIKMAKGVGILDLHLFLQRAADSGLNTKGAEVMILMGYGNPNVDAVDSYSRIASSSEAISQMRGTKKLGVFDTDRVKQKMRQLLKNSKHKTERM